MGCTFWQTRRSVPCRAYSVLSMFRGLFPWERSFDDTCSTLACNVQWHSCIVDIIFSQKVPKPWSCQPHRLARHWPWSCFDARIELGKWPSTKMQRLDNVLVKPIVDKAHQQRLEELPALCYRLSKKQYTASASGHQTVHCTRMVLSVTATTSCKMWRNGTKKRRERHNNWRARSTFKLSWWSSMALANSNDIERDPLNNQGGASRRETCRMLAVWLQCVLRIFFFNILIRFFFIVVHHASFLHCFEQYCSQDAALESIHFHAMRNMSMNMSMNMREVEL